MPTFKFRVSKDRVEGNRRIHRNIPERSLLLNRGTHTIFCTFILSLQKNATCSTAFSCETTIKSETRVNLVTDAFIEVYKRRPRLYYRIQERKEKYKSI